MFVLPIASPRRVSRVSDVLRSASLAPHDQRDVDRLLGQSLAQFFSRPADGTRRPALDVEETDSAYVLRFDVPGVAREQLNVSVEGRRVRVETVEPTAAQPVETGPADAPAAAPAPRAIYRERSAPRYSRTVSLPVEVDQAASQARVENGVLTLTLAKKQPASVQVRID